MIRMDVLCKLSIWGTVLACGGSMDEEEGAEWGA